MKPKYNNPLRTSVTEKMKQDVMQYCEKYETNVSDFLRDAIELMLKQKEEN